MKVKDLKVTLSCLNDDAEINLKTKDCFYEFSGGFFDQDFITLIIESVSPRMALTAGESR